MEQLAVEIVHFDTSVYRVEAVKKAAYRFLDRCSPNIQVEGAKVVCHLTFPKGASSDAIAEAVSEFKKEVLDQDLRQIVANETSAYRNAILALAFSSSNLPKDE